MKKKYPVYFTETESDILVECPDLEVLTQGKDINNAVEMAKDAIELLIVDMEDRNEKVPEPSRIDDLDVKNGTFYNDGRTSILLVNIDSDEYRKKLAKEI